MRHGTHTGKALGTCGAADHDGVGLLGMPPRHALSLALLLGGRGHRQCYPPPTPHPRRSYRVAAPDELRRRPPAAARART
jgi:hypothetical protein